MPEERLQKILSQTGVTSRRKAEDMILQGRVTVNGEVITELGSKADIETDHIKVDGTLLHAPHKLVYIALNKPRECVTTMSDPEGRQTVMHLLRGVKERVFPVGRLDYSSEGLLLLTNDGEFAHRITAPTSHLVKTYVVKVNGNLTDEQIAAFAAGLPISGRRTAPAQIKLIKPGTNPWYEVRLSEGRQNQIRMMFKHLGKLVEKLRRVKIGFLELDLAPGRYRTLTTREVEKFRHILKLDDPEAKPAVVPTAEPVVTEKAPRPARSPRPALLVRRPRRFAPPHGASTGETTPPSTSAPPTRPPAPGRFGNANRPSGPSRSAGPNRPPGPSRSAGPNRPSGPSRSAGPNRPSGPSRSAGPNRPPGPSRSAGPNRPSGPSRSGGPNRPSGPNRSGGPNRPSGPSRGDRPPKGKPRV